MVERRCECSVHNAEYLLPCTEAGQELGGTGFVTSDSDRVEEKRSPQVRKRLPDPLLVSFLEILKHLDGECRHLVVHLLVMDPTQENQVVVAVGYRSRGVWVVARSGWSA